MDSVELKISSKDWLYIVLIGTLFGFFISWFFYFLNPVFQDYTTILFSTQTSLLISLFSIFFITISNNIILPNINQKFWYIISFAFSFLSGSLGFLCSYIFAFLFDMNITTFLSPFIVYISITIGFLTFLIGLILHQFISMKYKNESIKGIITDSRLKALENELNPHFLFNALNSVSELIYSDQKKAENAILEISQFLRNAITKESILPLREELGMVETYVNIENIRFQNKIKLHISNCDTGILIPKFSIQLLVENAIKHGYTGVDLDINISVMKNEIVVQNNGKIPSSINCGVGLKNLKKRLKILNIGTLSYQTGDRDLQFTITLKD